MSAAADLLEAVEHGRVEEIRSVLSVRRSELSDDDLAEALCVLHIQEALDVLLDAGADLDRRNADGQTPIFRASYLGKTLLKQSGADCSVIDRFGRSGLHYQEEWALDATFGALDVDHVDEDGQTALHRAVSQRWISAHFVNELIDHGATEQPDAQGNLPSDYVAGSLDVGGLPGVVTSAVLEGFVSRVHGLGWQLSLDASGVRPRRPGVAPDQRDRLACFIEPVMGRLYSEDLATIRSTAFRHWTDLFDKPVEWSDSADPNADYCALYLGEHRRISSATRFALALKLGRRPRDLTCRS